MATRGQPSRPVGRSATNDLDSLIANPGSPQSLVPESPESLKNLEDTPALSLPGSSPDLSSTPRFILDPHGLATHDETTVDIVAVPCPGGHPLKSWNRDGLISRFFGAPAMRDVEVEGSEALDASWVRQGIRRQANRARILLYEHPAAAGATTLSRLADELLKHLLMLRNQENAQRPLFFLSHSVGGIITKMALVKAERDPRYTSILRDSYGLAFFGTPHQGSSYMAMPSLSVGIQKLLQLSNPLPTTITDDLRVGNSLLLHVDDDFKAISMDLKIWTFYETIDSRLSGNGSGDVYFTAPLTSIKSAILGMRQERIFPLQSDHANIASFGRHNVHTLKLFLDQLGFQIDRADKNAREIGAREALNLEQRVSIEVHGFFRDPVDHQTSGAAIIRAWSTRLPLKDFLQKGPKGCLSDRLNEVEAPPEPERFLKARGRTTNMKNEKDEQHEKQGAPLAISKDNPLGIQSEQTVDTTSTPSSPVIQPVDAVSRPRTESAPEIPLRRPPLSPFTKSPTPRSGYSSPMRRPSPLIRADFEQDLAVDRLSTPMGDEAIPSVSRSLSERSHLEYRDFPPFSQRSPSDAVFGLSDTDKDDEDDIEASPTLPEAIIPIKKTVRDGARRPSGTVTVDEVLVAFSKPEVNDCKFTWIHLPYNNPTWVKRIFETLQVSNQRNYSMLYNSDFWATKHTKGRHSQHYAYHAKPGCYFSGSRALSPRHHAIGSSSRSPISMGDVTNLCVFLPYLHFDSYKRLVKRRDLILHRLEHGRAHPVPDSVSKSDAIEHQVIWEFLGHDPPLNLRRTLDQYYYPSLRDTRSRDDDQMLYKLTKERGSLLSEGRDYYTQGSGRLPSDSMGSWKRAVPSLSARSGEESTDDDEPEGHILNGNVLMVDQLWLWVLGSHTSLTFFPKRYSDPIEGPLYQQADLRDSIFNEINVDLTRQCENALDLAALAALHAVSVLIDRSSHPNLEIFRIFEEAISVLIEKLTSSLKTFRAEGFRDKAFDYEPVENKERSIRARHKEEGRRAEQENRDNTSALLELRDIEDELLIMLHLFERQSKVISSMHATYMRPELRGLTTNGRTFLNEALKRLNEYIHQADEMVARVRSTRDDYDKLLQMVQRQAQVDEVRLSRLHADLASAQSRSVMIFTTFTVIFLPLSFFTGLFGMNTREWGGEGNLPLKTIGAISLPSSAVLIIAALVIAWSTTVRRFLRWASRVNRKLVRWCYFEIWRPLGKALWAKRKRGGPRTKEEGERRLKKEASDFWERHRLEREKGYQIPEVNQKPSVRQRSGARTIRK